MSSDILGDKRQESCTFNPLRTKKVKKVLRYQALTSISFSMSSFTSTTSILDAFTTSSLSMAIPSSPRNITILCCWMLRGAVQISDVSVLRSFESPFCTTIFSVGTMSPCNPTEETHHWSHITEFYHSCNSNTAFLLFMYSYAASDLHQSDSRGLLRV